MEETTNTHGSEVARILHNIEAEYTAAQRGLSGYAQISRHDFITARFQQIDTYHQQLIPLLGTEQAATLVVQTLVPLTDEEPP